MSKTVGILIIIGALIVGALATANLVLPNTPVQAQGTRQSHSILGDPSIGATQIDKIFCRYNSPLCGLGQFVYDEAMLYHMDPVWPVAFSLNESFFETTGVARYSLSLGNYNCLDLQHYGDLGTYCPDGRHAYFRTRKGGVEAFYRVLKLYYLPRGLSTVEKVVPVWAPSSDGNAPDHYIKVVVKAADLWRSGSTDLPKNV